MKLLSLKMPDALVEGMDELVRRGLYPSRSAVIRAAVRDLLRKEGMYSRSKLWNRMVMRANWRAVMRRVDGRVELPPQHTSDTCSRCGWVSRDPKGSVFRCESCGLSIDRQLNAAINLYLRMEGVPHQISWWDNNVLPSLVGGYFLTGAELKAPDELVRGLHEAVKPKLYYAYNRYADAYLPMPT